ncbi:hypothetical protein HDU96_002117, partial [Phlyctochytrium bullatum]
RLQTLTLQTTDRLRAALQTNSLNSNNRPPAAPRFRLAEHLIKTLRHLPDPLRAPAVAEALTLLRELVDVDGCADAMHLFACLLITGVPGVDDTPSAATASGAPPHTPDYAKALVLFRAAAKRGHADASYHAALCYEHARGVETRDWPRAVKLYRRAAVGNHPGAMVRLARMHLEDDEAREAEAVARNLKQAVKWLKLGAAHATRRHNVAGFLLGLLCGGGEGAREVCPALAGLEAGAAAAACEAAGVKRDEARCVALLGEAAGLECWAAATRLGRGLWEGEWGTVRRAEAVRVLVAAGRKGCVEAMVEVSGMFLGRRGVFEAPSAEECAGEAGCECGVPGSVVLGAGEVSPAAFPMSPIEGAAGMASLAAARVEEDGFRVDEDEAFYWARRAAERGSVQAAYAMGYLLEHGVGCARDLEASLEWYKRAAVGGCEAALARVSGRRVGCGGGRRGSKAWPTPSPSPGGVKKHQQQALGVSAPSVASLSTLVAAEEEEGRVGSGGK